MGTHKIGNKINCIIRAHSCDPIGTYTPRYDGEPYTIIQGENGMINFTNTNVDMRGVDRGAGYANEKINSFSIYNVTLTDKILNLIYSKKEGFSVSYHEKLLSSDDKKLYLTKGLGKQKKMVYVFYSNDEHSAPVIDQAYSTLDSDEIEVEEANAFYNVVYEVITDNIYSLDKRNNVYVTLDISSISNEDDNTNETHIHIDKAVVQVSKALYFNATANAIDLTFLVIQDGDNTENYIA